MVLWMLQYHLLMQLHTYVQFMPANEFNTKGPEKIGEAIKGSKLATSTPLNVPQSASQLTLDVHNVHNGDVVIKIELINCQFIYEITFYSG